MTAQSRLLAAAIMLAAAPSVSAAADITGLWKNEGGSIEVRFAPCGPALCATLVNSTKLRADPNIRDEKNKDTSLRSRPLKGLTFIHGMRGGPSEWTGGHLYFWGTGDTYAATMKLTQAGALALKVCPAVLLCQTQVLKRAQ